MFDGIGKQFPVWLQQKFQSCSQNLILGIYFFLSSWICAVCFKSNLLFWAEMFHQSNADHVTSYRSYTTFSTPEEGQKLVKICSVSIDR